MCVNCGLTGGFRSGSGGVCPTVLHFVPPSKAKDMIYGVSRSCPGAGDGPRVFPVAVEPVALQ